MKSKAHKKKLALNKRRNFSRIGGKEFKMSTDEYINGGWGGPHLYSHERELML